MKKNDFLKFEFFSGDKINQIIENNKELEYNILFVLTICWKIINDIDFQEDVRDWNLNDYHNFLVKNIDNLDLNKIQYKVVFKDLIKFIINDLEKQVK